MKMKAKRCPYCGKRVSYLSVFASRKKGEMTCERCGKNSKVYVGKNIFFAFAGFALISLAIMAAFIFLDMLNNPVSIILVAVPLIVFALMTPVFVKYEPFKKYKPSMEARKAGIEYADNLTADEFEIKEPSPVFKSVKNNPARSIKAPDTTDSEVIDDENSFKINSDVFNKIRAERNASRVGIDTNNGKADDIKNVVPVIKNVSENHASTGAGLKKIHSESNQHSVRRTRHYIPEQEQTEKKQQTDKSNRTNGNKYSANRKF